MIETLAELLDVQPAEVSRDQSFFALGLNSLNAIQFARLLQKRFNTAVGVTAVMKHPSIARLSQAISSLPTNDAIDDSRSHLQVFPNDALQVIESTFAGRNLQVDAILPCTPLQQAMLAASRPH